MARNPMAGGRSGAERTRRGLSFRFISESYQELRRVTWPTREEVYATTLVVLLTSAFFGIYLFSIDLVLVRLQGLLFAAFN